MKKINPQHKPVSGADQVFKKKTKANEHPGFFRFYEKYQSY